MVWTCPENGRGERAKRSYEMASTRKKKENEVNLNLAGRKGLEGEEGLMEEDCNDRSNWRKKII